MDADFKRFLKAKRALEAGEEQRIMDRIKGKMAKECQHEPDFPIAAFWFTCKHCGLPIESVDCEKCGGIGQGPVLVNGECEDAWCRFCNGTGISSWKLMEVGI